jgi:hypothetical protein
MVAIRSRGARARAVVARLRVVLSSARSLWTAELGLSLLVAAALLLWLRSLLETDLRSMNDLGLASVLPISFVLGLLVLCVTFALTLTYFHNVAAARLLLPFQVVALVLMLYATPQIVADVPVTAPVWQHIGVADWIGQHGAVDRNINAYFNWPGFFIALAFLQSITGLNSLGALGATAPVFFPLLYGLALFSLFKRGSTDARIPWLALWLFYCTNWVGQELLSPQAFGYFIYLNLLLVLAAAGSGVVRNRGRWISERLRHLVDRSRHPTPLAVAAPRVDRMAGDSALEDPVGVWPSSGLQRAGLVLVSALAVTSIVISHQLTPYAILVVTAGYVIANVSTVRLFPLLVAVIIFAWFTFAATPFLGQFLQGTAQQFGEVQQNFSASVTQRVTGTNEHEVVVYGRIVMTLLVWTMALVSAAIRRVQGHRDTAFLVIGAAPIILVALQSYGGEISLRVYFFSLPAAAFFLAASIGLVATLSARWRFAATLALVVMFIPLFIVARYGNARLDYFTHDEYDAVSYLYQVSKPGSEFVVVNGNLPWRWTRYSDDDILLISDYLQLYSDRISGAPDVIANTMADSEKPSYLVFTRGQEPFATNIARLPPEVISRLKRGVARSPRFRRIYANRDAVIYQLATEGKA